MAHHSKIILFYLTTACLMILAIVSREFCSNCFITALTMMMMSLLNVMLYDSYTYAISRDGSSRSSTIRSSSSSISSHSIIITRSSCSSSSSSNSSSYYAEAR